MRGIYKLLLTLTGVTLFIYFFIMIVFPQYFFDFLIEFTAGMLGVLFGFYLFLAREVHQESRLSGQIINNLLIELNNNLNSVKKIKPRAFETYFKLFQTSIWDIFSTRLVLDDIEILFDLGTIYHRFKLFNEGMKLEPLGGPLDALFSDNPNFLGELEKDIENMIARLEDLEI